MLLGGTLPELMAGGRDVPFHVHVILYLIKNSKNMRLKKIMQPRRLENLQA